MATREVTTRPYQAQGRIDSTTPTNRSMRCTYCKRPLAKRILAAKRPYCGKLCAALGLIADVHRENGIRHDAGEIDSLIWSVLYEGQIRVPVKVRRSESEKALESDSFDDLLDVGEGAPTIVEIEDDGTPDWTPDPILDADQDEIDSEVESMLSRASKDENEAWQ